MTESPQIESAEDMGQADWERDRQRTMQELASALSFAQGNVHAARKALDALSGPLYDVELVESSEASDLRHELDVIDRAARNASRIVELREKLDWTPAGGDPR